MGLKNYTTIIKSNTTIIEIEKILLTQGVTDIWKQYDSDGNAKNVCFMVITEHGKLPFKLPVNPEAVQQVLRNQKRSGKLKKLSMAKINDIDYCRNVSWRIIKDWIDAQMAIIELDLVKIEQVFLPYIWNPATGKTFYEQIVENKFKGYLMEENPKL